MKLFKALALSAIALIIGDNVAQAAPPSIMIVPDKQWCLEKGYFTETEHNGKKRQKEDYERAMGDSDFHNVELAINQIMAERGFPMISAGAQQESDDEDEMFDEAFEGAQSGAGTQTDSYDQLLMANKPDIILKVGWNINPAGSLYSADYRMEAVDSYSNKSVAPLAGQTGEVRRTVPFSVALKQTAKNNMDAFCSLLQQYFDDLQENGREVTLDVRIVDNGDGITMNSEYGGQELGNLIYEWVSDNTQGHQFTQRAAGRNMQRYNQVRIPLKDSKGRPQQAAQWANGLRDYLKGLGLKSENKSTGLGKGLPEWGLLFSRVSASP